MESEQRLRETIEAQLASAQSDIEAEKVAWESLKKKLDQVEVDDMRIQNKMLHDQMASLSVTVDKFQSTKASALMGKEISHYGAE